MIPSGLERQRVIINETSQYLRRDVKKYLKGAVGMWLMFGADCETGDAYRSTYYFFRHLDDALDGDSAMKEDPFEYTENIKSAIQAGDFQTYPILALAARSLNHFERVRRDTDNPTAEVFQLIDSMVYDRTRMVSRIVLNQKDLIENYHNQFDPIINLQFICLESGLRVKDVPDFPEVQARIYSLIDLESDWNKGLINVPEEVLETAGLNVETDINTLTGSPVIQEWMKDECRKCAEKLVGVNQTLDTHFSGFGDKKSMPPNERITQLILKTLLKKIEGYIAKQLINSYGKTPSL